MFLNRFKMIFHERKAENMAVRIKDIARKANVSEATVSLALNNNPLVNEETAKTIKRIAREMGYTPNPYARRLVLKKSNTLGVVVPDIENVFYASFVHYLNLCCRETNYSLSIFISGNRPEREEKIAEDLIAMQAEGVIYIPVNVPNKNMDQVQKLQAAGIPVICATTAFGTLPSVMWKTVCFSLFLICCKKAIGKSHTSQVLEMFMHLISVNGGYVARCSLFKLNQAKFRSFLWRPSPISAPVTRQNRF